MSAQSLSRLIMAVCRATTVRFQDVRMVGLSLALAAVVFAVDLMTPLGVANGVPYSLAVLLALNASSRRYAIAFGVLCSLLTLSDIQIGPGRGSSEMWKVLTNRFLALAMIWITLVLGLMRKHAEGARREAEEQSRRHLADLAHLSRVSTAGELATSLAHEINQPLAAISFQSEVATKIVKSGSGQQDRLSEALQQVTEQAHRAAEIVRGVRSLVQKDDAVRSDVQLNEVVRDVVRLTEYQTGETDVQLQLLLAEDLPDIFGDRVQLEQVLVNLVQNALEAVAETDVEFSEVTIETSENHGGVRLAVRDTGVGLGDYAEQRVFDRFYSSKPSGIGMGLAISRSIIESHGGRIWCESNARQGTTFACWLPLEGRPL